MKKLLLSSLLIINSCFWLKGNLTESTKSTKEDLSSLQKILSFLESFRDGNPFDLFTVPSSKEGFRSVCIVNKCFLAYIDILTEKKFEYTFENIFAKIKSETKEEDSIEEIRQKILNCSTKNSKSFFVPSAPPPPVLINSKLKSGGKGDLNYIPTNIDTTPTLIIDLNDLKKFLDLSYLKDLNQLKLFTNAEIKSVQKNFNENANELNIRFQKQLNNFVFNLCEGFIELIKTKVGYKGNKESASSILNEIIKNYATYDDNLEKLKIEKLQEKIHSWFEYFKQNRANYIALLNAMKKCYLKDTASDEIRTLSFLKSKTTPEHFSSIFYEAKKFLDKESSSKSSSLKETTNKKDNLINEIKAILGNFVVVEIDEKLKKCTYLELFANTQEIPSFSNIKETEIFIKKIAENIRIVLNEPKDFSTNELNNISKLKESLQILILRNFISSDPMINDMETFKVNCTNLIKNLCELHSLQDNSNKTALNITNSKKTQSLIEQIKNLFKNEGISIETANICTKLIHQNTPKDVFQQETLNALKKETISELDLRLISLYKQKHGGEDISTGESRTSIDTIIENEDTIPALSTVIEDFSGTAKTPGEKAKDINPRNEIVSVIKTDNGKTSVLRSPKSLGKNFENNNSKKSSLSIPNLDFEFQSHLQQPKEDKESQQVNNLESNNIKKSSSSILSFEPEPQPA